MSLNLAGILHGSAHRYPDRVAAIDGDREWSYRELAHGARRLAAALANLGVRPGDRVALMASNCAEFTLSYFGILTLGAIVVPLNHLLVASEIAYHLQDSGAVAVIARASLEAQVREGVAAARGCARLIWIGGGEVDGRLSFRLDELLESCGPLPDIAQTEIGDTAVILYTSGTTGRPKGAELTHHNMYENARWCAERSRSVIPDQPLFLGTGYVALSALPLFHSFGQTCVQNASLFHGGRSVYLSRWDPDEALRLMARHGVTSFSGVPTMYFALLKAAEGKEIHLPALRYCGSGGAAMPVEIMLEFEQRFPCRIMEGYGLSETSPVATFHTPEFERRPGSVGRAIDGCEVAIFNDRDEPCAPGERGEVVIRGHNIMKGYYRRPEATEEALRGGWFHSGDIGVMDAEGYVFIVDRKKDMIIRGGFNVYPRELEEILYAHEAVREAAVIGIPDEEHGEEVVAVIALREGATATAESIQAFCRTRMAAYKYPRHILFRDELPKGPTGKILKRELRGSCLSPGPAS